MRIRIRVRIRMRIQRMRRRRKRRRRGKRRKGGKEMHNSGKGKRPIGPFQTDRRGKTPI
jgi:hypothetical protein